jgi:hypothetical protein
MSERAIRYFVPGFLLVYFVIGFGRWISNQHEVYPIGAWGMFHRVDKKHPEYDLRILRIGDRRLVPPAQASDPDDPLGIELTAHVRLVLNGWFRLTRLGETQDAARYKQFIDRHIVGPDVEYEILRIMARSRPSEQDLVTVSSSGVLRSAPGLGEPDPQARFAFADTNRKFQMPRPNTGRRYKSKKSGR